MTNLDKIAKEYLSSKICGKCSMHEECDKGQVACIDVEIFKGGYKTCNEELTALINTERERQEKCNDIHLRTIAELEKENDSLKETIRKGTFCGDWNDDVHACQMYLKHEELQECINQLTKARKLIQKMKCCGNCKYNSYWGNEMHCNYGLKEALQKDKLVECKNMNKWEVKE